MTTLKTAAVILIATCATAAAQQPGPGQPPDAAPTSVAPKTLQQLQTVSVPWIASSLRSSR